MRQVAIVGREERQGVVMVVVLLLMFLQREGSSMKCWLWW